MKRPGRTRREEPDHRLEAFLRARGIEPVAGCDEAGRGPLAGPVTAAAVVLSPEAAERLVAEGLRDSKRLDRSNRRRLFDSIRAAASAWAVAHVEADEIDQIGIAGATARAFAEAVAGLSISPSFALVDGRGLSRSAAAAARRSPTPGWDLPAVFVVRGEDASASIAAASILAKEARDRRMEEADRAYPGWGFAAHKGYGTAAHIAAIRRLGLSPLHRRSFRLG